jgi:CheY-like chemotaxis protein/anti-sigma regulatory factor (Ser/Thr protein kinase)
VLLNLLSNAIKYNRPGGEVRVVWQTAGDADSVTITVADTGPGLSPQQQQRLFQPFERLGAERTGVQGSGLGLVITRLLVRAMGGTLEIDSEAGCGTAVRVSLPAASPGAPALPRPAAAGAPGPAASAVRPRVLYIEDNTASRALMAGVVAAIEDAGLALAFDGLSGVTQAAQLQPAVVIVDLNLPDIDGISVLRALRQLPATRDCRCVAMSADTTHEVAKRALAAGFDEFWPKPSGVDFMRERLARLLQPQG